MEANLLTLVTGIQLVAAGIADTLSEYYVNETTMTWDYASKLCQLAKPNISFNESGEYLNMDTGIITGKTWVGYVARFGNLNYEGCYFKNRSSLEPVHSFTTQHKVSVCFSACDTPYFALGEYNKCLCLKDLNGIFIDHFGTCNKQCSSLACGSKTSLSVYTKNTRDPIPSPESKVSTCMTYNKTMHLSTRKCTDKMDGILCPVHTDNGTKYYVREEKHTTWFESLLLCRQTTRSVNDSMAEALNEVNNDTGFYWTTSISLRHFDQNLDLNDETESLPQMYGYVDKNLKLEFKKGSRSFAALCKVGDHEDISTMSAYEKEIGREVTTLPADEKDIGLTVGVSVGIVVFLVLIVLLVLLCRRMYRKADVTPKTRSTLVEQPNYFVLERDYSARAATDHLNQTSPNATGNKSNYDVCIQDRQEDTTQSTNVYNVADSPSRTVDQHLYDHINANGDQGALGTGPADELVSAIGDGNTYDVHGSCQRFQDRKGQSDNIYNTTCNRMSDGSTYDHVGDVKVRGIAGDNIYSQVRPGVTDKDGEDTYNHI